MKIRGSEERRRLAFTGSPTTEPPIVSPIGADLSALIWRGKWYVWEHIHPPTEKSGTRSPLGPSRLKGIPCSAYCGWVSLAMVVVLRRNVAELLNRIGCVGCRERLRHPVEMFNRIKCIFFLVLTTIIHSVVYYCQTYIDSVSP
jgi:hypothetical protein